MSYVYESRIEEQRTEFLRLGFSGVYKKHKEALILHIKHLLSTG